MPDSTENVVIEDLGWAQFTIRGKSGDTVTLAVDVFDVYERWSDLYNALRNKPARELNAATVKLIVELGFPECSQYVAYCFVKKIADCVVALKKKASPSPGSPASTESTLSS